ncbi:glycosyltransferase family 2 protein [Agrococcus sp. SGAir0287]|uniref:glycosyltransferase family 2 protein n=1 Tax=Agrococcus sp. SGAir0287 TaxID=2070347 RepID=UPI0010CD5F30|nr:glycosyltransferase family 2 protein [Agrococcus sp. SGAir0287]QCR18668.1 glycosyl transferase family 2 [Agrococcus sp. SGAir0287]
MTARASVIVRTRNRPLLLERALASIAGQTMRDLQVVVVNDGGDAARVEAQLEPVRDRLGDLRVVHHEASVGRPQAMLAGMALADAPAFVFHDDDDSWEPEFLERTLAHLDAHPEEVGVATRCTVVWEEVVDGEVRELRREVLSDGMTRVGFIATLTQNSTPPICLVLRRAAYDEAGGYDPTLDALADWELLLRVLRLGRIGLVEGPPLALWHRREHQQGHEGNSVHAEEHVHERFNETIRDDYLRRSLEDDARLGNALFVTALHDRTRADVAAVQQHLAAITAHLDARFDAQRAHLEVVGLEVAARHAEIEALRQEVVALRGMLEARSVRGRLAAGARRLGGAGRR